MKKSRMPLLQKKYITAAIFAVLVLALLYGYWSSRSGIETPVVREDGPVPAVSSRDHVLWDGNPETTIINYYDFDCPHCQRLFFREINERQEIKQNVRLIYRSFPLSALYPHSLERMIIAECVYAQSDDKTFFAFLKAAWSSYQRERDDSAWVMDIAEKFVSNKDKLHLCAENQEPLERIQSHRSGGLLRGVFSTPSFLVDQKGFPIKRYDLLGEGTGMSLLEAYALGKL